MHCLRTWQKTRAYCPHNLRNRDRGSSRHSEIGPFTFLFVVFQFFELFSRAAEQPDDRPRINPKPLRIGSHLLVEEEPAVALLEEPAPLAHPHVALHPEGDEGLILVLPGLLHPHLQLPQILLAARDLQQIQVRLLARLLAPRGRGRVRRLEEVLREAVVVGGVPVLCVWGGGSWLG